MSSSQILLSISIHKTANNIKFYISSLFLLTSKKLIIKEENHRVLQNLRMNRILNESLNTKIRLV